MNNAPMEFRNAITGAGLNPPTAVIDLHPALPAMKALTISRVGIASMETAYQQRAHGRDSDLALRYWQEPGLPDPGKRAYAEGRGDGAGYVKKRNFVGTPTQPLKANAIWNRQRVRGDRHPYLEDKGAKCMACGMYRGDLVIGTWPAMAPPTR